MNKQQAYDLVNKILAEHLSAKPASDQQLLIGSYQAIMEALKPEEKEEVVPCPLSE